MGIDNSTAINKNNRSLVLFRPGNKENKIYKLEVNKKKTSNSSHY
jgi:hypothetical protein